MCHLAETDLCIINKLISQYLPDVIAIRHQIHSNPELGFHEFETAVLIQKALNAAGLQATEGIGGTGVAAQVCGPSGDWVIGLRADLDALPINEETGLPFSSRRKGIMHACGHDGHVAILLGTALVLGELKEHLRGTVRFIFQPAEEILSGAKAMIADGILRGPAMDRIYALHLWPWLPLGHVGVKTGTVMAGADRFTIVLRGKLGHGANPHLARDTITAAAYCITQLQTIVSRETDPTEPVVLSVGRIKGGSAYNILGDPVQIEGTIRMADGDIYERMPQVLRTKLDGIALSMGVEYDLKYERLCPPVYNCERAVRDLIRVSKRTLGRNKIHELPNPSMIAEDFAFFLREISGCLFFLGVGETDESPALHSSRFAFDDAVIAAGIRLLSSLVLSYQVGAS